VTFHDQLRTTFRLGSGVFLVNAILFTIMYVSKTAGYPTVSNIFFVLALAVLAATVLILVAGLVGRSAHRWVWFNVIKRSERRIFGRTVAERLLASPASPVLRLWLHIDPEGKDRDGLV
jgi:hypothetical protein